MTDVPAIACHCCGLRGSQAEGRAALCRVCLHLLLFLCSGDLECNQHLWLLAAVIVTKLCKGRVGVVRGQLSGAASHNSRSVCHCGSVTS